MEFTTTHKRVQIERAEQGSHFSVDEWLVEPEFDRISRGDEQVKIRPRETDLLSYLASRAGQVVSAEEILEHVWAGVEVGGDAIYYTISQLRKATATRKWRSPR